MTNSTSKSAPQAPEPSPSEQLDSWKEIAAYLKREVRTVQRWEKKEGLPVYRHEHTAQSSVYAFKSELDAWWRERRPRLEQEKEEPADPAEADELIEEESKEAPAPTAAAPQWRLAVGVVVALLATAAVVAYLIRPPAKPAGKTMLAVLPFENLSGDPEQKYFSEGLTDEMITKLGRLDPQRLGVIARTSSMRYEGTGKSLAEIGGELGVQYILEGAVRRSGERVRISAQLVQVVDQSHIWADSFDRDLRDILKVQAEVAEAIASQIQLKLEPTPTAPRPVNPQAYDAYLKGRFYWSKRGDLRRSIPYFEQAIARDPDYALAHAGLAYAYGLIGQVPTDLMSPQEARPRAKAEAIRALQLDPGLAEAHTSLANTYMSYDWDWEAAKLEFDRAIHLNPSDPTAHEWYGHYLIVTGHPQDALGQMKQAKELDPLSPLFNTVMCEAYYFVREYDQAIEQCRYTLKLDPNFFFALIWLGSAYREKKMYPEAIEAFRKVDSALPHDPAIVTLLGHANGVAGNRTEAQRALNELQSLSQTRYVSPFYIAGIYTGLGDKDQSFLWLDRAYAQRTDRLIYLGVDPMADPLRSDPRFRDLLRRIGLPQ